MTEGNAANKQDTLSFDGTLVPVKVINFNEETGMEVEIVTSLVFDYSDLRNLFWKLWSDGQRAFCELKWDKTTYQTHAYIRSFSSPVTDSQDERKIRMTLLFKGAMKKARRK